MFNSHAHFKKSIVVVGVYAAIAFFTVAGAQTGAPAATPDPLPKEAPSKDAPLNEPPVKPAGPAGKLTDPDEPRLIRGNDKTIAAPPATKPVAGPAASLKFENAPLADVVHVILREIVKVDHIIHPPLNGAVTLSTQNNVSADQALLLLEAALQANGYQMVVDNRGLYHVGKPESLRAISPAVRQVTSAPLPPGHGAIVVPLKFIGAGEMASILRTMAPEGAVVRVDTVRNLIVMVGSRTQAEGWLDLVNTFDVDLLKGMSVGVFPLKHVTTREVEAALRLLNVASGGTPGAASGGASGAAPRPGVAAAANNAAATGRVGATTAAGAALVGGESALPSNFPLYGALRVLPIERLNSILIVTPRAAYLDQAREWIEKLDQPGNSGSEPQLFVYRVQNGAARHLADVLNGLFGAVGSTVQGSNSGVVPGLQQTSAGANRQAGAAGFGGGTTAGTTLGAGAGQSTVQGTGVTSVSLPSGLRIIGDELNNSVLVYGTPREYQQIEATLKRLDISPTQVLIEASIIEVSLTDDLKYGVQWLFDEQKGSGTGTGVLSTVAGGVLGGTPSGFSYTLRNSAGGVRAVLNALAEKSLVKVISSPSLMVLDNHTASIAVGNQQPIRSSETVTTGGNVTTAIQYKDTGVSLSVTPSVNAGNMVTMLLNQAVTDVGAVDTATGQRSFLQRQIGSKVAVRAGETLVLGGLIRDNSTTGNAGLPGLKDIPLFGGLFGQQTSNGSRTELLVVITPQVVRTTDDLREVSADLRDRMRSLPR
jgi:general secretion pathway protein D